MTRSLLRDGGSMAIIEANNQGGIDVVHGHSSHHPRPIEVYQRRLILYGCGDFIDDYEGIEDTSSTGTTSC